jgi:GMP synthase (glutamine-hydrolysing)
VFAGISAEPVFYQLHGGEVKRLPDVFSVLAESESCKIQAVAHKHAPLFGTQFHPELFDETHPEGKRLFENFFSIAGRLKY